MVSPFLSEPIMTIITEVPAFVLHIAAQFASVEPHKEAITGIHLQGTAKGMRIASTNGHFAFRCLVPFGEHCLLANDAAMGNCELLLPASAFKKKANYARKVVINNGEARFIGGKKDTMDMLEARPCNAMEWEFPRHFDSLWPDPASMANSPGAFTAFNSDYMRIICDMASKWSDSGRVQMHQGATNTEAIMITTSAEDLELQWLLLPVMVRK